MIEATTVKQILESLGYPVKVCSGYYQTRALYRFGSDVTSLAVYPEKNIIIDFVTGEKFSVESLVARTLKINDKEATEWLKNRNIVLPKTDYQTEIKQPEIYSSELLMKIEPNHEYVIKRGISENVAKLFEGGVVRSGKLKDRYVWPIFNSKKQIVGFTGRDLTNLKKNKYMHFGQKTNWCWPCFLNAKDLRDEVILVESPMDVMSLFECGIKNVVCLFGIDVNIGLLNFLIKMNPNKIIIATNNDIKHNVGQEAAIKLEKKLSKYFDSWNVEIRLPKQKDINESFALGHRDDIIRAYG
jgi:hypothetical protein